MSPAMKLPIPAAIVALIAAATAQETCLPVAKSIQVLQTQQQPLNMIEFQALDDTEKTNWATDPDVVVTQSSTYAKGFKATNAIDGDSSTFSHTSNTTDHEWWKIEFGTGNSIGEVRIKNRWCKDPLTDPTGCRCRMSHAKVWLFGEDGKWLTGHQLDDTCNMDEILVSFDREENYCKTTEELATDVAESPDDKLEAGVCQDDVGFVSAEGYTCADIEAMETYPQTLLCKRAGNMDYMDDNGNVYLIRHFCSVTCGDCVPDASSGLLIPGVGAGQVGDIEPTYSPTYLPSAQPVVNSITSSPTTKLTGQPHLSHKPTPLGGNTEPTYSPTYLPSAQPVAAAISTSSPTTKLTAQPHLSHKPTPLGGNTDPTYSPTYLPSAQPIVTPKEPTDSPTYLPSAQPIITPSPTTRLTNQPHLSHKPTPLGGNTEPTYSPTYLPSAQPIVGMVLAPDMSEELANKDEPPESDPNLNNKLDGHAYSAGDVCEDDQTFVSDKGITCKSFVYAETVHCRTTTGMHDSDFNALRYSDFCPETCGVCAEVAASMVTAEEGVNSTAIGVGVGLSVGFVIVLFFTWLWCNAGKMKDVRSHDVSEFRDDPTLSETRGEYRDESGVGLTKPGQGETADEVEIALPNMEGLFPDVDKEEEVVPKTEIV